MTGPTLPEYDRAQSQLQRVRRLDRGEFDVTQWEADFLNSILRRLRGGWPLTDGQLAIVVRMELQYLGEEAL